MPFYRGDYSQPDHPCFISFDYVDWAMRSLANHLSYLLKPCSINHLYSPLRIETFGCPFIKMINPGLPQWLTGKESGLPMQETRV